jgi:hypothetical protein
MPAVEPWWLSSESISPAESSHSAALPPAPEEFIDPDLGSAQVIDRVVNPELAALLRVLL